MTINCSACRIAEHNLYRVALFVAKLKFHTGAFSLVAGADSRSVRAVCKELASGLLISVQRLRAVDQQLQSKIDSGAVAS